MHTHRKRERQAGSAGRDRRAAVAIALAAALLSAAASAQYRERTGKEIVDATCATCHAGGAEGAPKIGDRAAWTPRMKVGLEALVKSAVHGHGAMPARGGVADLSDPEVRSAVIYMFNYGIPTAPAAPAAAAPAANPYHKVIAGTEIHLGVVHAEAAPAAQRLGKAPSGKGHYYLNVSLFDAKTKAAIGDAKVKVKVSDPLGAESKALEPISANNVVSYGGYFRMQGPNAYTITAQIERPGIAGVTEAKFEYKVR